MTKMHHATEWSWWEPGLWLSTVSRRPEFRLIFKLTERGNEMVQVKERARRDKHIVRQMLQTAENSN